VVRAHSPVKSSAIPSDKEIRPFLTLPEGTIVDDVSQGFSARTASLEMKRKCECLAVFSRDLEEDSVRRRREEIQLVNVLG
jgi:hypothetical protein